MGRRVPDDRLHHSAIAADRIHYRPSQLRDRCRHEHDFHDLKKVHGAGQQQVRNYWVNVAVYHSNLWLQTLIELCELLMRVESRVGRRAVIDLMLQLLAADGAPGDGAMPAPVNPVISQAPDHPSHKPMGGSHRPGVISQGGSFASLDSSMLSGCPLARPTRRVLVDSVSMMPHTSHFLNKSPEYRSLVRTVGRFARPPACGWWASCGHASIGGSLRTGS